MTPRPYQYEGRDFLAARRKALLADQMRVGKTPQAILACDKVSAWRVLVVCPAIVTHHWKSEWVKWSPRRDWAVLVGKDTTIPSVGPTVVIISYDRLVQRKAELAAMEWDVLILDEAHYVKNPAAKRTHAALAKDGVVKGCKRVWALTGTPSPNHVGELWPIMFVFGATTLTYTEFVQKYCYVDKVTGRVFGSRLDKIQEIKNRLHPYLLRRTLADVAPDLPPLVYDFLEVSAVDRFDLESEDLTQVTAEARIAVAKQKVRPLVEEIKEQLDSQAYYRTVVFGFHLEPLQELRDKLVAKGIAVKMITGATPAAERHKLIKEFGEQKRVVIVAQLIAAGVGVDMSAASHGYFLELDFVPGNNEQAAHRLMNATKKQPVTFDVVTRPGTVDDRVQQTLVRKIKGSITGA